MHELMMDCLHLLAAILSLVGSATAILILTGIIKGIIDAINHHGENHE